MPSELQYDINILNKKLEDTKKDFVEYISDNSYPLGVRWDFFCDAPDFLKNQYSSIHTFKWENTNGEISWYDDFYCDRYATVSMDMVIDSMLDRVDEDTNNYTKESIKELQEEILSKNLGSFINDW